MLNPDIFSGHSQQFGEQREHGEQPRKYRCISVPSSKTIMEQGEQIAIMFPLFPLRKMTREQIQPRQYWLFPVFPPFPRKNIFRIESIRRINPTRREK